MNRPSVILVLNIRTQSTRFSNWIGPGTSLLLFLFLQLELEGSYSISWCSNRSAETAISSSVPPIFSFCSASHDQLIRCKNMVDWPLLKDHFTKQGLQSTLCKGLGEVTLVNEGTSPCNVTPYQGPLKSGLNWAFTLDTYSKWGVHKDNSFLISAKSFAS